MNLDSRIINKKIFDSFGIEEAEKYLGKEGYFANSNEMFSNLDNCIFGKLEEIKDDIKPYCDSYLNYRYFLPKEFVSKEELVISRLMETEDNYGRKMRYFKLSEKELTALIKDRKKLANLESYANYLVDNWDGFEEALSDDFKISEEDFKDFEELNNETRS